ncbi:MAG TPA: threonine dehydratase [Gemmatimonadaceae bacterium]
MPTESRIPSPRELSAAEALVHAVLPPTPQYAWPLLRERVGTEVWVKHENHTPAGAFKIRGGLTYFDWLRREHPDVRGVVAATRGNHGQSIGFAARRHGLPAAIVVPHGNGREKNDAMRALGVELIEEGEDFQASVEAARRIAGERGWHRVPAYHPMLVAGVATYGLELLRAVPHLDSVYVPIGMGSGIVGVLAAREALGLRTTVVGVVSSAAPAYARSLEAGRPVSHPATTRIADGMACRTPDPDALEIIAGGAERVVEVSDDEVEEAMRILFATTHTVAEGAGAAALAALLQERGRVAGRAVGVVVTGGNVDSDVFARVLASGRD